MKTINSIQQLTPMVHYVTPCIWIIDGVIKHDFLAAQSQNTISTLIDDTDYATQDARSNGWSGFDDEDSPTSSSFWE